MAPPIGFKHTEDVKRRIGESSKKRLPKNLDLFRIGGEKTRFKKGMIPWNKGLKSLISSPMKGIKKPEISGVNHPRWVTDRNKLKRFGDDKRDRRSSAYRDWRMNVWRRDNFKCKIANTDCSGRIEAHHILGWSSHPELRYAVNNGITLCQAHHPHKKEEEAKLSPYFQTLVAEMESF
jgi:hypothetical protein